MFNELSTTTHGRILSLAIAIALVGGGISATIHDPMGIALMCVSLLASVVLSLTAIAMSIESRPEFGVMAVIILPFLLFLYAIGLTVSIHNKAQWGAYAFMALGALFGLLAARGGKSTHVSTTGHEAGAH